MEVRRLVSFVVGWWMWSAYALAATDNMDLVERIRISLCASDVTSTSARAVAQAEYGLNKLGILGVWVDFWIEG